MKKQFIVLCIILMCMSCASAKVRYIDPTGRTIPTPHYMLQSTTNQIQTVSYWATFKSERDLDGSLIQHPTFIPFDEEYKFSRKKYSCVTLTIEVNNPNQIDYQLVESVTFIRKYERKAIYRRKVIGVSNLPYRQFTINLPFQERDIGKIQYGVELMTVDEYPIMHFGDLNYKLTR